MNEFKAYWKLFNIQYGSCSHLLYNLLKGRDLKCGFSPITNKNKLANGQQEWGGFNRALSNLKIHFRHIERSPEIANNSFVKLIELFGAKKEVIAEELKSIKS